MPSSQRVEHLKTVAVVVLFLTALLFLFVFWSDSLRAPFHFPRLSGTGQTLKTPIAEIVTPNQIVIGFGNGDATVVAPEAANSWNLMVETFRQFCSDPKPEIQEIARDQYVQIMDFRSATSRFLYSFPMKSFGVIYKIPLSGSLYAIEAFSEIGYSLESPDSLFFADEEKGKYYRLIGDPAFKTKWEALIAGFDSHDYTTYYPIGTFIGSQNRTVMPVTFNSLMKTVDYRVEWRKSQADSIAQSFFGENLDFVRTIEESKGTIVYMYGYSQRLLSIEPNGVLEYKELPGDPGIAESFDRALQRALIFAETHGGWKRSADNDERLCLEFAVPIIRNGASGYQFHFQMIWERDKVYYIDGDALTVEVAGGQTVYFKRDRINVEPTNRPPHSLNQKDIATPINVLAESANYTFIRDTLKAQNITLQAAGGEALFNEVTDLTRYVGYGYVRPQSGLSSGELAPAWIFLIRDTLFYFDLYDGRSLGYHRQGA